MYGSAIQFVFNVNVIILSLLFYDCLRTRTCFDQLVQIEASKILLILIISLTQINMNEYAPYLFSPINKRSLI